MEENKGSISRGIFWMFLISILFFWLPLIGPFAAGLVGGKKAGSVSNALAAVFLPIIIFSLILFFFASAISGMPLIGVIAGSSAFILVLAHIGPLLLGAIVGGLFA